MAGGPGFREPGERKSPSRVQGHSPSGVLGRSPQQQNSSLKCMKHRKSGYSNIYAMQCLFMHFFPICVMRFKIKQCILALCVCLSANIL